jgi:erythronate-4-phosphate dehydrogenase
VQESILHYATLCTPHIAGHSAEAKKRAIYILSYKLHQACGLPPPLLPPLAAPGPSLSLQSGWQQKLLSYYHPLQETLQLQKNPDRQNFLSLRKAHKRHEICWEEK